ncbi:MAG: hypothetical protein MJ102_00295 [Clostridia bacterium]|nr:hypothetical protein [Clostridia bacterium]
MKIEILYDEICNLYGDPQNAAYLKATLHDAEFIHTPLKSRPYFADYRPDMIIMGSMSESTQRLVIEELRPYRERICDLIDDGVVFLMTGNASEVFYGQIKYVTEEKEIDGLGIFDFSVSTDWFKRCNAKVLAKFENMTITGFRSQFGEVTGDNSEEYFIEVTRGLGMNKSNRFEGVRRKNFFGTQLLGPILPLNPEFCEYLIRLAGGNARAAFREEAMEAFLQRVKEFSDPATEF